MNRKWGHLTGNASSDLQSVCENESLRMHYYETTLQKVNSIFVDALTNHGHMFSPSNQTEAGPTQEVIKKKNEFGRRCISGFPISWFSVQVREPSFETLIQSLDQKDISSPFYNMYRRCD